MDVDLQEIDLAHAAEHAATINRMRADRKQILIRLIRADPVKLRQIINNLLVNAIKFSRSGTDVTIRGATVQVESEVGRGSLFRVVFPLAR